MGRTSRFLDASRAGLAAFLVGTLGVVMPVAAPPVEAQSPELLELAELLPDPTRIHPDIAAQVSVDLSGIGPVAERLSAARADLIDAVGRGNSARAQLASLEVELELLIEQTLSWRSEEATARARLEAAQKDLGAFAIDTFVEFEQVDLGALRLEGETDPTPTISDVVGTLLTDVRFAAALRHTTAVEMLGELEADAEAIADEMADLERSLVAAEADALEAEERVAEYEPAFELALLGAPVRGVDFPVVVLDAYYRAELIIAAERPSCGVRWDHLAGIGRVESRHGTYGGNAVGVDGRTTGEILGPVLDGDPWLAIPDTDGGRHDGDTVWDRAVGPMQFIPGSWARFGRDGNGDGEVDPHNMYDATVAAALHLCGTTGGLSNPGNFQRALLGYNRSVTYGVSVMGYADNYLDTVGLVAGPGSVA